MREFEIINIKDKEQSFEVEIEYKDTRKRFRKSYPYENGWEEMIDGDPKWLHDLRRYVRKQSRTQKKEVPEQQKKQYIGKTIGDKNVDSLQKE